MSLDISDKDLRKKAKYLCGGVCTCDNKCLRDACHIIRVMAEVSDAQVELARRFLEQTIIPTRQSQFLKLHPKAVVKDGFLRICPALIDSDIACDQSVTCDECAEKYWLEEVLGNEL